MKKIVNIIVVFLVLFLSIFTTKIYAAPINSIDVTTDKETVHPGETITLNVKFGEQLGAYTVDVAYDNKVLEYVSAEGGTANDNGTRVRVYFFDETGGSNPRDNMSVTFRAKADLTTSNPTDLSVTAEGLANPDASVSYDDITSPIVKNITVEPKTQQEQQPTTPPEENTGNNETPENNNGQNNTNIPENNEKTETPETLPQTGNTVYLSVIGIMTLLIATYIILKKKD